MIWVVPFPLKHRWQAFSISLISCELQIMSLSWQSLRGYFSPLCRVRTSLHLLLAFYRSVSLEMRRPVALEQLPTGGNAAPEAKGMLCVVSKTWSRDGTIWSQPAYLLSHPSSVISLFRDLAAFLNVFWAFISLSTNWDNKKEESVLEFTSRVEGVNRWTS